jgi:hypothetical protein
MCVPYLRNSVCFCSYIWILTNTETQDFMGQRRILAICPEVPGIHGHLSTLQAKSPLSDTSKQMYTHSLQTWDGRIQYRDLDHHAQPGRESEGQEWPNRGTEGWSWQQGWSGLMWLTQHEGDMATNPHSNFLEWKLCPLVAPVIHPTTVSSVNS